MISRLLLCMMEGLHKCTNAQQYKQEVTFQIKGHMIRIGQSKPGRKYTRQRKVEIQSEINYLSYFIKPSDT